MPLGAVANIRYEIEQPTIWRRSRLPTITLQSSIRDDVQPNTVVEQLQGPRLRSSPGYAACRLPGTRSRSEDPSRRVPRAKARSRLSFR